MAYSKLLNVLKYGWWRHWYFFRLIYVCLFFPLTAVNASFFFTQCEKEPSAKGEGKVCACTHGRAIRSRVLENRVGSFSIELYTCHTMKINFWAGDAWREGTWVLIGGKTRKDMEDLTSLNIHSLLDFFQDSWLCSFMFVCLFFFSKSNQQEIEY